MKTMPMVTASGLRHPAKGRRGSPMGADHRSLRASPFSEILESAGRSPASGW
jgi:hypothetical protein